MYRKLILVALFTVFSYSFAKEETTCEVQRQSPSATSPFWLWDIQCDDDGFYKPLQCTRVQPKWCACYDKEKAITSPSRGTETCVCHLVRQAAIENGASSCDIPQCDRHGRYEKKQCCDLTRMCRCVDAMTGSEVSPPTHDSKLVC